MSIDTWYLHMHNCVWGGVRPQSPTHALPSTPEESKSTKTWSAWGGKVAYLSEKDQKPFPQWAFIGFILHSNTGEAHQSLSGSKDQTVDNKELWELIPSWAQLAKGLYNFGKQTHFGLGPLSFKLRVLAKQVSQSFMYSFLGLIAWGTTISSTGLHRPLPLFQASVRQGK